MIFNMALDVLLNKNIIFCFLLMGIIVAYIILRKKDKEKPIIILGCASLIAGILHFLVYNFHNFNAMMIYFKILYIIVLIVFILSFFRKKKKVFITLCIVVLFISFYGTMTMVNRTSGSGYPSNYSYYGFTKSFSKMIDKMEKDYPLSEHKGIDYNYLRDKYLPLVEKAEKNDDMTRFYELVYMYSNEFKDGHVSVSSKIDDAFEKLDNKYAMYYGFDTIMTDDGNIIAVMVNNDSEAYKNGLRNGYIITKKDGRDIQEVLENDYFLNNVSIAVKYNENLLNSTSLFDIGNDEMEISFLDVNSEETTIKVKKEKYNNDYDLPSNYLLYYNETDNLETKMISNDIGYINITSENFGLVDIISYLTGDAFYVRKLLVGKLNELRDKGMKKLVIDLRWNNGGTTINTSALASPFLSDSFEYSRTLSLVTKKYYYERVKGTGEYSDIPIIVLVNNNTASAADALTYLLKMNKNVEVVGFMPTANSCQSIGGSVFLTNGINIRYPIYKNETTDGKVFIDTGKDGIETIKLDYKIPITKDNVMDIFNYDGDYVLDYIIKMF